MFSYIYIRLQLISFSQKFIFLPVIESYKLSTVLLFCSFIRNFIEIKKMLRNSIFQIKLPKRLGEHFFFRCGISLLKLRQSWANWAVGHPTCPQGNNSIFPFLQIKVFDSQDRLKKDLSRVSCSSSTTAFPLLQVCTIKNTLLGLSFISFASGRISGQRICKKVWSLPVYACVFVCLHTVPPAFTLPSPVPLPFQLCSYGVWLHLSQLSKC